MVFYGKLFRKLFEKSKVLIGEPLWVKLWFGIRGKAFEILWKRLRRVSTLERGLKRIWWLKIYFFHLLLLHWKLLSAQKRWEMHKSLNHQNARNTHWGYLTMSPINNEKIANKTHELYWAQIFWYNKKLWWILIKSSNNN